MKDIKDKIKDKKTFLKEKDIKPTFIRLKVLDYLMNHDHPSAEMIYEDIRVEIPTISMTTVYNALNTFIKKGIIKKVNICDLETRFDIYTEPHHHLLCIICGRIIDIDIKCKYFKEGEVLGHKILELYGHFKGICKDCSEKKGEEVNNFINENKVRKTKKRRGRKKKVC